MALIKLQGNTKIQGKTIFETAPQAPAFAPTDISGLQLWLDASDTSTLYNATAGGSLVTTNGAAVARWADKSGNNRHATQATVNNRPIKNGNSLYFNGSTSFFDSLSGYLLNIGQGASGTFVCMASGSGDSLLSNERTSTSFRNGRFGVDSNKLVYTASVRNSSPFEYSLVPAAAGNANQINFYAASYIAPTNTGTLSGTICTNGAFQTVTNNSYTVASQGTNSSFTTLEIGRYRNFTYFTSYFTGSIRKILAIDGRISRYTAQKT